MGLLRRLMYGKGFYIDKRGYPRWNDSDRLVHRTMAYKATGGSLSSDKIVHHKDGNKRNFNPDNLEVMTKRQHRKIHGIKKKWFW